MSSPQPTPAASQGRSGLPVSRVGYSLLALGSLLVAGALLWPEAAPPMADGPRSQSASSHLNSGAPRLPQSDTDASGRASAAQDSWQQHPWAQAGMSGPAASDDLADHVPAGSAPKMGEVIARLNQAGVRTGLGAFNPPGTNPPLMGLAVPDGYELPPGYVRHHQATDDGQRIEAILMFAPDRAFLDAAGRPGPIPSNRVVPAEMAPPGFPIRYIEIPPALDASAGARS